MHFPAPQFDHIGAGSAREKSRRPSQVPGPESGDVLTVDDMGRWGFGHIDDVCNRQSKRGGDFAKDADTGVRRTFLYFDDHSFAHP
ncbi:hypothetical protein D3C84_1147430 [compost metagenome]